MTEQIKITEELLQSPVASLDFTTRIVNTLENNDVKTVMDLLYCCGRVIMCDNCELQSECPAKKKLLDMKQMGVGGIDEIYLYLERKGIIRRTSTVRTDGKGREVYRL